MITDQLKLALATAQRCQRNWDLTRTIPDEDIDTLKYSVINSPSKQNEEYYAVSFITDRTLINNIYLHTNFSNDPSLNIGDFTRNSQVLANLLVVFSSRRPTILHRDKTDYSDTVVEADRNMAIGVAAGQLAYTASLLGYKTGFCKCFDITAVSTLLNEKALLLLGIGYPDATKPRREHHRVKMTFTSFNKALTIKQITPTGTTANRIPGTSATGSYNFRLKYTAPGVFGNYMLKGMAWLKQCGLSDEEIINVRIQMQTLADTYHITFGDSVINESENSLEYFYFCDNMTELQTFKTEMARLSILQSFHASLLSRGWRIE